MTLMVGALTSLAFWWVWGSLAQVPFIHDEAAYVLQAEIFATGRWTAEGRPLPEFFEQSHVLTTPVLASKYPPGHSLLLTPGVFLGLPGLVPVLLNGVAGAALFGLARSLAGSWVGLGAWLLWLTAPGSFYLATYLSQTTTTATWLLALVSLRAWHRSGRTIWLLSLSLVLAWGGITRPLTMLALVLPIGAVTLWSTARRRAWSRLAAAVLMGTVVLGVVPLWNARTTGEWNRTPYTEYARLYLPFDKFGFGLDSTPPLRPLPPDLRRSAAEYEEVHRTHTIGALPLEALLRALRVGADMWWRWRAMLLPFAIIALLRLPPPAWIAVAGSVSLLVLHLGYAHPARWSVYYVEALPVLAFLTAFGLQRSIRAATKRLRMLAGARHSPCTWAMPSEALAVLILLPLIALDLPRKRSHMERRTEENRRFAGTVRSVDEAEAVVFVRYAPDHHGHLSFIRNVPDLEEAPVWIVYDRGEENAHLLERAPERVPFLFDQALDRLVRLPSRDDPRAPGGT